MTHLQSSSTKAGFSPECSSVPKTLAFAKAKFPESEEDAAFYSGVSMIVASAFETNPKALFAPTRCRAKTALARQVAVYLIHVLGSKSYTEIGCVFGRDRTTAAYACRLVEDRRDDPVFDRLVEQLEKAVDQWSMRACAVDEICATSK